MQITNVRIKKLDNANKLKAVAAITIDDVFVVHGIRVIEGKDGNFIVFPSRKTKNGKFLDVAHPLNTDVRNTIQAAVLEAYNSVE